MSRNYDNWERLVAAVVKREQIWQLCHQDSISTICSESYSSSSSAYLESSLPVSFGSSGISTDTLEFSRRLRQRSFRTTDLVRLLQDVQVSEQHCFATGTRAVVKSLITAKITEDEFEQHMIALGNCRHENVGTPWAYHFSEKGKLIVYDYYSGGSVYDMLHGNGRRPDWERRARIAVGAARGIAHIHTQCGGKLAHGNIKSSNIFVNSKNYGCVSDFGLAGIPGVAAKWWDGLEYYASEHKFQSPSQKSDVYSFGLLLLELVTGRSVVQVPYIANRLRLSEPDTMDLNGQPGMRFVDELDMKEMALEKFPFADSYINTAFVQQDLRKTLQVAKKCLAELPIDRPTMSQVVLMLDINSAQISNTQNYDQHPAGEKKSVWHRLFPFGR